MFEFITTIIASVHFIYDLQGSTKSLKFYQDTSCKHTFCKACLIDYAGDFSKPVSCPSCSKMLTSDFITSMAFKDQTVKNKIKGFKSSSILNRIQLENFQTSTKIEALVSFIQGYPLCI